ncbi:mitochondrial amidoxime reducing component 2-like [Cajanus cajan]|uniref:mitochondrial amidoxime reducing component 2-like n=1 Tax=Cajanus cajan TaxID=3821 RepID=UPI00098D9F71|nr:mitochondrial amidoxime reducing component 2-like [Cajanus cajan]
MGVGASTPSTPSAKVSAIFVYPIKSCRGISLSHAPLTPAGFRWDRQWMVVNPEGQGRMYTQRVEPRLALVEVELPSQAFLEDWEPTQDSYMVVKAPGMQPLKICLSKEGQKVAGVVSVWEWTGSAWDEGAEASQWFSDYLGKPCQLVRFNTGRSFSL